MEIRYYLDPETGQPHIYGHGVIEVEVEQVLRGAGEDLPAAKGSRMKLGRTMPVAICKSSTCPTRMPKVYS